MAASDRTPTLDEFLACCAAECEFLVREFGFARLESPREYNIYSVLFRRDDLGVDLYGESWGRSASCDLVRGEDRLYFSLMIPASEREAPKVKTPPGQLDQVRTIAGLLRVHATDFLRGDTRRFDATLEEWRRVTRPRPLTEAVRRERERQSAVTAAGHASRSADHAEVVRLLQPHADTLSQRQRRMLETALARLRDESS